MPQPGFVYILVNPSANEFLKIGKTERDPDARAKELSSATGVPTPFYVAFQSYFQDCTRAEEFVHTRLAKYRVANNREFFRVPLRQAISAVLEAERVLRQTVLPVTNALTIDGDNEPLLDELGLTQDEPWRIYFDVADACYYGKEDTLQDYEEALRSYKQAAKLGCTSAYWNIGGMYRDGNGCIADKKIALDYFKEGARNKDDRCWAEMASIFFSEKHFENMEKCWQKYLESHQFSENAASGNLDFQQALYARRYVAQVFSSGRPFKYEFKIHQIKREIVTVYNRQIEYLLSRQDSEMVDWLRRDLRDFERQTDPHWVRNDLAALNGL